MGRSRYKFRQRNAPYFVTCTVLNWLPVFTRPEPVGIVIDSLDFLIKDGMKVYAYVILENHMHLIAQSDDIGRDMGRFKAHTAKQLIALLKDFKAKTILDQLRFYKEAHKQDRTYQFWQEGVHPELIHNLNMMRDKVEYIHQNPVKRGYVDEPEHWRYSSARDYMGRQGMIEICQQR
ncbi:REP element-mobilizing transposase RayT [Desulfatibacillum alkenivorans DSM 16219]|uniref:REP element-mobilizing transposase RayT n=1 Tax=Desulfatibacillum alkenivorans DSM 16219 TaxID=1121393 RepID=A0A1M6U522_9BACT|nr:transposase [Desulfatibacillum alkenivorans]SHK64259.1 REP element-mobilizing transposase RayT [Desulfatibacillum alkenivorans DSM 16219]